MLTSVHYSFAGQGTISLCLLIYFDFLLRSELQMRTDAATAVSPEAPTAIAGSLSGLRALLRVKSLHVGRVTLVRASAASHETPSCWIEHAR